MAKGYWIARLDVSDVELGGGVDTGIAVEGALGEVQIVQIAELVEGDDVGHFGRAHSAG